MLETGHNVEVHKKSKHMMKRRTKPVLYLHLSGNDQGGVFFRKIVNREQAHRKWATVMPILKKIVQDVHRLAKQHKYLVEGLQFRVQMGKTSAAIDDTDTTNNITWVSKDNELSDDSNSNPDSGKYSDDDSTCELHDRGTNEDSTNDDNSDDDKDADVPGLQDQLVEDSSGDKDNSNNKNKSWSIRVQPMDPGMASQRSL